MPITSSSKEEETGPLWLASGFQNIGSKNSPATAGCKRVISDSSPRKTSLLLGFGTRGREQMRPLGETLWFMSSLFPEFEERNAKQSNKRIQGFRNLGIQELKGAKTPVETMLVSQFPNPLIPQFLNNCYFYIVNLILPFPRRS
jgi:hypothetical protein